MGETDDEICNGELMDKCCCGFGHRLNYGIDTKRLYEIIEDLVIKEGVNTFFTGRMGEFDVSFCSAVLNCKNKYPYIKLLLIKPYMTSDIYKSTYFYNVYNEIIIPEVCVAAHPKAAIYERNKWMIERSDYVLSGIYRNFGGAYNAVEYAKRAGKYVIELCSGTS